MALYLTLWLLTVQTIGPPPSAECYFVQWWASKALYIAKELQLPADRWHIVPEGYSKQIYDIIIAIKQEAYDDNPALARRIARACVPKIPT